MNKKAWFWVLAALFAAGALIDIVDGDVPKMVGSVSLAAGFILVALGAGNPGNKVYQPVSVLFFAVAAASFFYRILKWYGFI